LQQFRKQFAENRLVHNLHKTYLHPELLAMLLQVVVAAIYIRQRVVQHKEFLRNW
jgi:hypothetical protein